MPVELPMMESADAHLDCPITAGDAASSMLPESVLPTGRSTVRDASVLEGQGLTALAPQDDALSPRPDAAGGVDQEIAAAVGVLTQIALQLEDPVSALDEGAEALAEMLAARDAEIERRHQAAAGAARVNARRAEFEGAYRHARLHRVGELVDLGYQLDQAVAITNANEADIRSRALAAGRDPSGVIYRYALLHGYKPRSARGHDCHPASRETSVTAKPRSAGGADRRIPELEALAAMSDEEFGRATRGDRWQRLLQGS